jgi:cell wall-associated NlpC family hydrolase
MNDEQGTTNEIIIAEARSWLGTKWRHGQRVKHEGTDCVGFIIELGKTFGWIPADYIPPVYSSQHALHRAESLLNAELARFADPVAPPVKDMTAWRAGDILAFRYERTAGHAGIYIGEGRMIHSYMPRKKVIESPVREFLSTLDSVWRPRADV